MENLVGRKFGKLTVISLDGKGKDGYTWNCLCDCGQTKSISGHALKRGSTKSCGCSSHTRKHKEGDKFGNLTILKMPNGNLNKEKVLFKCDCGKEIFCYLNNVVRGTTTSCGCLRSYYAKQSRNCHGESYGRLYQEWSRMKTRCYNKNTHYYKNYGGRGIKVCDEWQTFLPFREWAYQNGYNDKLTLERKDVNGDYCPENCTWITMKEQASNKRTNTFIEFNGKRQTISQWSRELGISKELISWRLRNGKSPKECLSTEKWKKF